MKIFLKKQTGQASLIMVLICLSLVFVVVATVGLLTYNDIKAVGAVEESSQSYYAAEAGIEDALLRIVNNLDYNNSYSLTVGSSTTNVSVSGPITDLFVTSTGNINTRARKLQVSLGTTQSSTNVSFNYGVQVGYGGLVMSNNAGVNGNIYSNGNIIGSNGSYVTGSAFVANGGSATADQSNATPSTPASSINFRNASTSQDLAQSFEVTDTQPLNKFQFYIRKTGSPANATLRLVTNSSGNPSTTTLATGTLNAGSVGTSYGWLDVSPSTTVTLNPGVTYWVVIDNSATSSTNYFTVGANSTYANGSAKVGQYNGTWNNTSPSGLDAYFKVFLGGTTGSLSGITVGTGTTGDAHAHTVNSSTIRGNLYCQTGSGNNKACNTSQADPVPQDFPFSDANLEQFKAEAATGTTISGDHTITNGANTTLGPAVITGNLTITNGVTVTLTGTVYVQGNVTLANNVIVRLDSAYGTNGGTFVADGYISVSNNATFQGSGQSGSYMLVVTSNDCDGVGSATGKTCTGSNSAMTVGNNAGAVVMFAPYGQVEVSNGAGAKEITGYKLTLSNNAVITYDVGLANSNFSSGPGGGFEIDGWEEVE